MKETNNTDISNSLNQIIKTSKETNTITTKKISDTHHTFGDLYTRERILLRLITSIFPTLSFKSLHHYNEESDPMFNGDFMVGLYTPKGPIAYHFKLKYLDEFSHLDFTPNGPKYDNYTEEEKNERLNYMTNMIIAGKTADEIMNEIESNTKLHNSCKPLTRKKQ